ncbi:MAG: serine/threonine-protein kinase [Planctomycetota bacterium]|jgi:tetratricopeptide (TPR) repeat protein
MTDEPLDAPKSLGDYDLEAELGRGGMGTVYRAHERSTGKTVAIKLLHPWLGTMPTTAAERFRREAETGISIEHDNIVRTLEFASDGAYHFLVMEYVEGRTLRELADDLGEVPESLLREIARQVVRALVVIHDKRVLHRDLKPENVLITDDMRVRVMDLGTAKVDDMTLQLTREGEFVGSIAYAAPEQFGGEDFGPSADRYALGVLLYELASGTNPFRHDSPMAAIQAHQNVTATPLTLLEPATSRFFSEVVGTLLEKDPARRFESTAELLTVLEQGEASDWWNERSSATPPRPPIPVERTTGIHGRATELAALGDAWCEAAIGSGRVVLLAGDEGAGKTRVVAEFVDALDRGGVEILYGGFSPLEDYAGLVDGFRARFAGPAAGSSLPEHLSGTLLEGFSELLQHGFTSAALRGPELATALSRVVQGLARERPVVWVLDDFHFASTEAARVVQAIARSLHDHPILLILTTNNPSLAPFAGVEPLPTVIKLPRLSRDDITRLLEDSFRDRVLADWLAPTVHAKSGGLPLFAHEIIRALTEQEIVRPAGDGFELGRELDELVVPNELREHVARRVGGLDQEARNLLDAAAVAGVEFDPALVAAAVDQPLVRALQDLAELERREGIVQSAGQNFRFAHHLDYEVIYEELSPRLKEELHMRMADALQGDTPIAELPEAQQEAVVRHHLYGSRPEAALRDGALEKVVDRCQGRAAIAADVCTRALSVEGLLSGVARANILLRLCQVLEVLGKFEAKAPALEEAAALAAEADDDTLTARVGIATSVHGISVGDYPRALEQIEASRDAAAATGDDRVLTHHDMVYGLVLSRCGRFEESMAVFEEGRRRAEKLEDEVTLGRLLNNQALALGGHGVTERSLELFEESLRIGERHGDLRALSHGHGNVGMTLTQLGRFEEALPHLEKQRELAILCGEPRSESYALTGLANVLAAQCRLAEAIAMRRRRGELSERIGDRYGVAVNRLAIGQLLIDTGDLEGAQEELASVVDSAFEMGKPDLAAQMLAARSRGALAADDLAEAERFARAAVEAAEEAGTADSRIGTALCETEYHERRGDAAAAREALRPALDRLERVQSPELVVPVRVRDALLRGEHEKAEAILRESERFLEPTLRLDLRLAQYRASQEREPLEAAHAILKELLEGVPEEQQDAMRAVSWHREILDAHG